MKSRKKKESIAKFIRNISNVVLESNEVLLFEIDTDSITVESAHHFIEYASQVVGGTVLGIPRGIVDVRKIKKSDIIE